MRCWNLLTPDCEFVGPAADEGYTFSPALNPTSKRLLLDATNLPGSFHERQRHFERSKTLKVQNLQAELVCSSHRVLLPTYD